MSTEPCGSFTCKLIPRPSGRSLNSTVCPAGQPDGSAGRLNRAMILNLVGDEKRRPVVANLDVAVVDDARQRRRPLNSQVPPPFSGGAQFAVETTSPAALTNECGPK